VQTERSGQPVVNDSRNGVSSALRLYTQFANPQTENYSWNSSFSDARQAFGAEQTALYFDRASKVQTVRDVNPNLNFDVASFPHRRNRAPTTYADFYGLGILKGAQNKGAIFSVLRQLTGPNAGKALRDRTNYTPVQKTVVSSGAPADPYKSVFLDAAVNAQAWLDPDPEQTREAFAQAIQDVNSNRSQPTAAAERLIDKLNQLLP
jgi:ABC-type glycerol-3-phosphate transport system substrate-binding protein